MKGHNASYGNFGKRCYESHPPLKIKTDQGEYVIYGGSCSRPIVTDADVYVGFDMSMTSTHRAYPWEAGEEFLYYIQDMNVPQDAASFKRFISYLSAQLVAQKKVHIGCIGGHGRTGLVLAALVTYMTGELDSISYVRKNYCEKAVESALQVDFLNKHFGIVKVAGAKEAHRAPSRVDSLADKGWPFTGGHPGSSLKSPKGKEVSVPKGEKKATPIQSSSSIWGPLVSLDKLPKSGNMKV